MEFRILKEKITPDIPVLQAGFAARTHKSMGVHDDPYASVILIKANETVIIIALDLLYGDRSFACGIKKAISEKYGLSWDKIIISYSHTHSVVSVTGEDIDKRAIPPYSMSEESFSWDRDIKDVDYTEDIRYYNSIKKKIMDMVDKGIKSLAEGDVYIYRGKSRFGISRRFPSANGVLWKPNFDENCIDMDLYLLKFVDKSGSLCGLIYSYACHPTALNSDNYLISADFPGVVRKYLEERNVGMIPVFLQGCGADIKPYVTAENGSFRSCNYDELEQAGISLADKIQEYIAQAEWRKINVEIETRYSDIKLYTEIWDRMKWEAIMNNPDEEPYRKKSAAKALEYMKNNRIKSSLPYYMSLLRLDKRTCILCLEGEVVSDIGKRIKKLFDEDIIVLGYTNSSACYIPTKQILLEGGYESDSFIAARLAGPFVPEVEDIIIGRAAAMVED